MHNKNQILNSEEAVDGDSPLPPNENEKFNRDFYISQLPLDEEQQIILLSKIRSTKAFKDLDISAEKKHEADSIKSENNAKIELGIIGGDDD